MVPDHEFLYELESDPSTDLIQHQFLYNEKHISLCYGLGMAMVHPDFPFQPIREKEGH